MNNRVQQRFDRSIREAETVCDSAKVRHEIEAERRAVERAARLLPVLEDRLSSLTGERRAAALGMRARMRRTLGLTMDRGLNDFPTRRTS